VPGRHIKHGYGFTSRGCPRRYWFCSVWKRDPTPRLLPIVDCWNILDDNLLACPRPHVEVAPARGRGRVRSSLRSSPCDLASLGHAAFRGTRWWCCKSSAVPQATQTGNFMDYT
jgi:hypothetical protein